MTIRVNPENNEPRALSDLADFHGWRALEIGCGDERLTCCWPCADLDKGNQKLLRLFI